MESVMIPHWSASDDAMVAVAIYAALLTFWCVGALLRRGRS